MQPWTFVHVADIQPGSPKSFRYRPAWQENWDTARQQIIGVDPDLLLIGGDLSADGWIHRFELAEIKADLDTLPFPYYAVPGNMDTGNKHTARNGTRCRERDDIDLNVTSAQLRRYVGIFGPMEWTHVHKGVRFSGFYAAVAGSGLPEEAGMWRWLAGLKDAEPRTAEHVIIMHYALFVDAIDEPNYDITDRDQYLPWYFGIDEPHRSRILRAFKAAGVTICISGHIHCRKHDVVDGIRFDKAPAPSFAQFGTHWPDGDPSLGFLRYDVSDARIARTFVPLARESAAQGYGPGGHPRPALRDYSLAWQKTDLSALLDEDRA
ncbi:MAG: metallophosphoesterase [Kiritimatiellae bacterium]|nr:metallophosphoesterase [Kiritimatiellia bacterium]